MKTWWMAGALLLAFAAAAPVRAADLSVAPLYKAPPAVPLQSYNWSGFYLGVNGGGAWGTSNWSAAGGSFNLSGGQAGGTAGMNWQTGHVVLGLEGDVDWSGVRGTAAPALCPGCATNNDWLATVRGRAGYAFDRFMPFVSGGLAVGDIRATAPGAPGANQTNAGWTVGGGLEFALSNNWTAKAEYLHVDLGNMNCGFSCGVATGNNVSVREDIVRGGVNYRFGN